MEEAVAVCSSSCSMWKMEMDWDKRFNNKAEVSLAGEAGIADANYLSGLIQSSNAGSSQLAGLAMQWESTQNNALRMLKEELDSLNAQRSQAESKRRRILSEDVFCKKLEDSSKRSILDGMPWMQQQQLQVPTAGGNTEQAGPMFFKLDESQTSVAYWKAKSEELNQLLAESLQREALLLSRLKDKTSCVRQDYLQNQLERVDNFLHFVLRNAPIVVAHQDQELRYRFVYNQHPNMQAEIIGKSDSEIYRGSDDQETVTFKKEVIRRGMPARREFVYKSPDIGVIAFLCCAEPVFSKNGDVIGLNTISIDISEELVNREKLIRMREEAAVQGALESELQKTMRITEEAMKSKQILATMSHEIRSPLSGVISMAEILAATNLDPEQKQLVEIMVGSGDLVLQLINDILDLSKAESGAMKLEAAKFRPREVVRGVLQTAAASLQKKTLTLEGTVSEDVPLELVGDVLRIRQILINLVSNAIKFTREGTVKIAMRVVTQEQSDAKSSTSDHSQPVPQWINNGDTVWLECGVSDTGIGIPDSALPFLFTKYMQVSETHARKYGGTGLGLAICKQLIELMGGKLKVESQKKKGSTFSFTLPCKLLKDGEGTAPSTNGDNGQFKFLPTTRRVSKRSTTSRLGDNCSSEVLEPITSDANSSITMEQASTCEETSQSQSLETSKDTECKHNEEERAEVKVLLAEDNKVNIMVAQSMLKRVGLQAKVVNNGAEAVQAVRDEYFDLILMDVYMPVMDGLEATRLIRKHQGQDKQQRSSIVAMTANALPENVAECYTHGMDSFISKPVTFGKLQQVIQQFLPSTTKS